MDSPIRTFRDDPLTVVQRRWMCGQGACDGEMKCAGVGLPSYPMQFPHECSSCGRQERSTIAYPRIAYLPIEALDPPALTPSLEKA